MYMNKSPTNTIHKPISQKNNENEEDDSDVDVMANNKLQYANNKNGKCHTSMCRSDYEKRQNNIVKTFKAPQFDEQQLLTHLEAYRKSESYN